VACRSDGRGSLTAEIGAELQKDGALGKIAGSRDELVVTSGPAWRSVTFEKHPGLPQITVRKSDYDRIIRNLDFKRKVVLEINADNRWYKGPIPCYNVIADIKGSESRRDGDRERSLRFMERTRFAGSAR